MLVLKEAEQLDDVQIGQGLVERDFLSHFVTLMRFLKTGTPGVVTNAIFYFYPLCTRNKTWDFSLTWRGGGKLRGKKSLPWAITQNSKK